MFAAGDGNIVGIDRCDEGWAWRCTCGKSGKPQRYRGTAVDIARAHARSHRQRPISPRDPLLPEFDSEQRRRFNRTLLHIHQAFR